MKKFAFLLFALTIGLLPHSIAAQVKAHHVLFAVTSPDQTDWMLTMGNISNLRKGFAPEAVEVEVVAYGPGLSMLKKDSAVMADIQKLSKDGVAFVACENSMRRMQVTKDDLIPGVGTVPSGIVEVVKKEEAGWSYIKGGK